MCEEQSDEAPERSEERERQRVSATHELSDRGSERQRTALQTIGFDVILFSFFTAYPFRGTTVSFFL